MKREIKFRGKDIVMGEWVIGDLHTMCDRPHIHTAPSLFPYAGKRSFIDPDTVGQFTGLEDKNGCKIFEGDIVRKTDITLGFSRVGQVVYNDKIAAFRLHVDNGVYTERQGFEASDVYNDGKATIDCKYEYEVLGNKWDNPELLNNEHDKK